jgi:predicted lactoylglutathione lyase
MPNTIFVNLPVADLVASTRFYEALGCNRNEQFSDDTASSMVWTDQVTFHLLTRDYFQTFTAKPVGQAKDSCQLMIALTADSREEVDRLVETAARAGGRADPREPKDLGFMYNRAVEDPDGYVFELVWLNPAAMMDEMSEGAR